MLTGVFTSSVQNMNTSHCIRGKETDKVSPLTEGPLVEPPPNEVALASNVAAAAASEVTAAMCEFTHAIAKGNMLLTLLCGCYVSFSL